MPGREFVDKHFESFAAHDADGWASHCAENAVLHDPQYPEPLRGRDAVRKDVHDFFTAIPDIQFELTNTVAEGNQILVEGVGSGTHQGPMEGPSGTIEPTQKRVAIKFATVVHVDGSDMITEERRYYDMAGMMQQLGLLS